jgi:hypothetical protein
MSNVQKYQESLKCYYNRSVVQRELEIGDLVLMKDIQTKDKHSFHRPEKDHSTWWTLQHQGLMY